MERVYAERFREEQEGAREDKLQQQAGVEDLGLTILASVPCIVQIALDGIGEHVPDRSEKNHHAADDVVRAVIFDAQFGEQHPGGVKPDQHDQQTP